MLLNTAKCLGYSFYRFWVIKEKPTGTKITKLPPPPALTQIRVEDNNLKKIIYRFFEK